MMATTSSSTSKSQNLLLPNGRNLGYATYGLPPSPTTPTIFYFHGFPSSRLEAALWFDNSRTSPVPAHVIAIDRPGIGLSSFQASRRVLDWPSDVLALADHLHVHEFRVLALSGGAPYALACLKEISKDRLIRTTIVSGLYPPSLGTSGMLFELRALLFAASWAPGILGTLLDWKVGKAARNPDPKVLETEFMKALSARPEKDRKCMDDPEVKDAMVESAREAFRHGGQGPGWDLKLMSEWGFELEEVTGTNITLWHGGADVNTPFAMAEKAERLIEGCVLKAFDDEFHMSLPVNHTEDIVKDLLK